MLIASEANASDSSHWHIVTINPDSMMLVRGLVETFPSAWTMLAQYPTPLELFERNVQAQLESNQWMRRFDKTIENSGMEGSGGSRDYGYLNGQNLVRDPR